MEIQSNFSLKAYNTFGIDVKAKLFTEPVSMEELMMVLRHPLYKNEKKLILGGGSNMLFISDFDGIVIHPKLLGKNVLRKNNDQVIIKAKAGENWDELVEWTINQSYSGLENLSLIPGSVGACPVQNIGAYGVEVKDFIEKVEAVEKETGNMKEFSNQECMFGYRESIFKKKLLGKYIIVSVDFKLNLNADFKINYGAVKDELTKIGEINLKTIRQAVINIRQSKLPDPDKVPNAGSFFKNPSISKEEADNLKQKYPEMPVYENLDGTIKIAAGWLIENLGWKGKSFKGAGVHERQALVLINRNKATGKHILELATKIKESVSQAFGINLEYEVNII